MEMLNLLKECDHFQTLLLYEFRHTQMDTLIAAHPPFREAATLYPRVRTGARVEC